MRSWREKKEEEVEVPVGVGGDNHLYFVIRGPGGGGGL